MVHKGSKRSTNPYFFYGLGFVLLSVFVLFLLCRYTYLDTVYCYLLATSVSSFSLCAFDKSIAASRELRVPEKMLYFSALCGGSLGLIAAMYLFRHKTQKAHFQLIVLAILVLQIVLWRVV